jgi:hypothetical protein
MAAANAGGANRLVEPRNEFGTKVFDFLPGIFHVYPKKRRKVEMFFKKIRISHGGRQS